MTLSIDRFEEFFGAHYRDKSDKPKVPFPWQTRLANEVFLDGWPDCIDLPTASGKTAAIDIAVFVLACQANRETAKRTVGRRIFFTVNRRVIVDEAFERSYALAEKLLKAEDGILKEVADALREISGDDGAPPLDVVQLRGGIYRDRAWARSITQPIVVCTTADQLGSRLLFRGYGVSQSSRPIHAALCGCDSLVLLDEAHVTRAFCETMQLLTKYQRVRINSSAPIPPMRFVQLTATPAGEVKKQFRLDSADRGNQTLNDRLNASKAAELVRVGKKPLVDEIVRRASQAAESTPKAIGIIVNRVQTARDIHIKLLEKFGGSAFLAIGGMRPIDRDVLQKELRIVVGPGRPEILDKPVLVVATQCLEVGADYDFDVLITECASIDALRQRFGRLNRTGRPIEAVAAILTNDESLKGDDPIYRDAIKNTWEWLWSKKDGSGRVDFGIAKFQLIWNEAESERASYLDDGCPKPLLSPKVNAAVLLPAHLDALCQTNPQPAPSPEVSLFVHGPTREMAEVNVCWRADLGDHRKLWPDIVRLLPPTSPECMTVPLVAVKRWMGERFKTNADADVPIDAAESEDKRGRDGERQPTHIVVWRYGHKPAGDKETGRQLVGFVTDEPGELRPGDTIIMPVVYRNWFELGHIPTASKSIYTQGTTETTEAFAGRCDSLDRSVDVAEQATRLSRLRLAVRLHDAFPGRSDLRQMRVGELRLRLRSAFESEIKNDDERRRVLAVIDSPRIERRRYDEFGDDNPETKQNELIVFKAWIEAPNLLGLAAVDDDDGDDDLSEGNAFVPLDEHTEHVVGRLAVALNPLHLNDLDSAVRASAPPHDIGKSDVRFQAMLTGITPYEAMGLRLRSKGDGVRRTRAERNAIFRRAMYPRGFRHEMVSVELIAFLKLESDLPNRELLLHLVAAHHGYARPFAPVCFDEATDDELRSLRFNGNDISGSERRTWVPSHRLDSGVAERFWKLTRQFGWWGLAWLESILRLADQQASAIEQEG